MIYNKIPHCRICESTKIESILDLGMQYLTGIFPKPSEEIEAGPLELVKCKDCHLVQLAHNYQLDQLYGETYGYRSGLNASMVEHLREKVSKIAKAVKIDSGDLIVDIGANDGTTLGHYEKRDVTFVGIDPSGKKFHKYYKPDVQLIPDFFSSRLVKEKFGSKKAKVVTSFAMFYDLEKPIQFAKEIAEVLDKNGVWVFEQSYLPLMIDTLAYDTVCHEHLEYYALAQIQTILKGAGLELYDVEFNDVNGGSFSVIAGHPGATITKNTAAIEKVLKDEVAKGYQSRALFDDYAKKVHQHKDLLKNKIKELKDSGLSIHGYGASTKGNVILQYCGFTAQDIAYVAEVNEEKFGKETPGTKIPIISEKDSKAKSPGVYLVLPWHFKKNILKREARYILEEGGKFLFPLPEIHIVDKSNFHQHA